MDSREFCSMTAQQLVADMLDAKILDEKRARYALICIESAIQTAVQHAALGIRSRVAAALDADSMHKTDAFDTEAEMVEYIRRSNHPDD